MSILRRRSREYSSNLKGGVLLRPQLIAADSFKLGICNFFFEVSYVVFRGSDRERGTGS